MTVDETGRGHYKSLFDLSGKVAIVTGGAGILGRHFSAALADFGARVAVVDIDGDKASNVAGEIAAKFGSTCIGVGCDVSDSGSVRGMVDRVESELDPVDILHNNAATKGDSLEEFFAPPEEVKIEAWRRVMAVNLDGMFLVAQAVGSRMAERRRGSIIQTSSIYGVVAPDQRIYEGSEYAGRPINTPPVYSASKAGVIGLTKYLASYWGPMGVRVNSLTPGGVDSGQNATFVEKYSHRVPMNRMGRANDLVGALVFLASDASSYVTGHNLIVDGGLSVW